MLVGSVGTKSSSFKSIVLLSTNIICTFIIIDHRCFTFLEFTRSTTSMSDLLLITLSLCVIAVTMALI